tara:strand:+ start:306 stop:473 length:168 start_codon:yes stop_codon:yes gene_type:complete
MTYRELIEQLSELEDDQLSLPVMAHFDEEFFKVVGIDEQDKDEQLQDGHPFLQVD